MPNFKVFFVLVCFTAALMICSVLITNYVEKLHLHLREQVRQEYLLRLKKEAVHGPEFGNSMIISTNSTLGHSSEVLENSTLVKSPKTSGNVSNNASVASIGPDFRDLYVKCGIPLRNYTHREMGECFRRKNITHILFYGDSRMRYKYREFTMFRMKWSTESCEDIRYDAKFYRDSTCNDTKYEFRTSFWWERYYTNASVDKFINFSKVHKPPDVIFASVGPWYCFRLYLLESYPELTRKLLDIWRQWENTTMVYYFKQEAIVESEHFCKNHHINIMNEFNSWEYKDPPPNVIYASQAADFQAKLGNKVKKRRGEDGQIREIPDAVHVSEAADQCTVDFMINEICGSR